jgi:uncharacterized membrane protein YkvA (DUF1232 family)
MNNEIQRSATPGLTHTQAFVLGCRAGIDGALRGILGTLSFIYLLIPTGGIVEFLPDFAPVIGHADEVVATFFFTRVLGITPGAGGADAGKPGAGALLGYTLAGLLSSLYLIAPTAGIVEFLPDALPIVGNLDEMMAATLLLALVRTWERLLFGGRRTRDADAADEADEAEHGTT